MSLLPNIYTQIRKVEDEIKEIGQALNGEIERRLITSTLVDLKLLRERVGQTYGLEKLEDAVRSN